jgi:hypothetical protein
MLKHIAMFLSVSVLSFLLASCQLPPDVAERIGTGINGTVAALDRNGDGIITTDEAKASTDTSDPMNWLWLLAKIGGLFGVPIAIAATRKGSSTQAQVDELYDRMPSEVGAKLAALQTQVNDLYDATHTPIAKPS